MLYPKFGNVWSTKISSTALLSSLHASVDIVKIKISYYNVENIPLKSEVLRVSPPVVGIAPKMTFFVFSLPTGGFDIDFLQKKTFGVVV